MTDQINLEGMWEGWAGQVRWMDPTAISVSTRQKEQVYLLAKHTLLRTAETFSILEIGPHDATMAMELLKHFGDKIDRMVLVDGAPMLEKCRAVLKGWAQVEYNSIEEVETIEGAFDLMVSCHCLSETPLDYQNFLFDKFFPVCNELFVLQTASREYRPASSAFGALRAPFHDNLVAKAKKYFTTHKEIAPITPAPTQLPDHIKITWARNSSPDKEE